MGKRKCPICFNDHGRVLRKIDMKVPKEYRLPDSYNVVLCEDCGFVYADTSASMEDYDWYYTHCNFYGDDSKDDNSLRFELTKNLLDKYVRQEDAVLEMGAGNGRFSIALKNHGYLYVTGTDPSEKSVERLRAAGIDSYVFNIYSEVSLGEYERYDCIFLFEVAEHLLVPTKGIENVSKMLKTNGVFMISVPDYSQIGMDSSSIPNYFNLEHINYFSEISLDYLMARYGLERVAQKRAGIDLIQVYKKTDKVQTLDPDTITASAVCAYFQQQDEKEEHIGSIIENLRAEKREIVIWGTGSYVMSLLATTNLMQCRIKGFVDNNKIKQGRKIYDHMIYPPEYLKDKKYTVLICSMLNGEQIKQQIDQMDTENEVIIL